MPCSLISAQSFRCGVPNGVHRLCSRNNQRGCQPRDVCAARLCQKASTERENSNGCTRTAFATASPDITRNQRV